MFENYEVVAVSFMVAKKQVFAMGGFQILPVNFGLFYGGSGRMFVILK
jgi:hypothetical protein